MPTDASESEAQRAATLARGREKLASLHEAAATGLGGRRRYTVDDCLVALTLLARKHSISQVSLATNVHAQTLWLWKTAFMNGVLEDKFPGLVEAMADFDPESVPALPSDLGSAALVHSVRARVARRVNPSGFNPYRQPDLIEG